MTLEEQWKQATQEFLHNTPEGQNWNGSSHALELMNYLLRVNGLADAEDKVAALKAVAAEMAARGLDVSPEKKVKVDANDSPAEILKNWKSAYGTDQAAGEAFSKFFKK